MGWQKLRFREQARSHIWNAFHFGSLDACLKCDPCGREPAREGASRVENRLEINPADYSMRRLVLNRRQS